ncbi:MAG TPA: 3-oxoacyl-[acyl-carrier-protein] reductase [Halanaerobiales bacterium]|nr:3-oxoacyl-[acyl-carrier-protein] reductase [Halanaerobiales bacterium]
MSNDDLTDKVAVITGSSRGIGASIALKMARDGANIVLNYHSDSSKKYIDDLIEKIKGFNREVIAIQADVSKMDEAKKLINEALDKFSKIDILVNNAGINSDNLLLRMSEDDWDKVMDVNLKGVFNCTKTAIKSMMKKRQGKIINLTSVVGIKGNAGQSNYSASKAGVIGFTKSIARELAGRNITANAVAPGFITTDMTDDIPEDAKKELMNEIPLSRLGKGEDVAELVSFLASDRSDYITGQVINVDGGMAM